MARAADYTVDLPLATLVPGSYLLRLSVSSGEESATRDVRFALR
jgi:hypothetical protein